MDIFLYVFYRFIRMNIGSKKTVYDRCRLSSREIERVIILFFLFVGKWFGIYRVSIVVFVIGKS